MKTLSLFILISLVALRPLILETYDSSIDSISSALQGVSDPSPLRTLIFDLLICVAAFLWLISRALGKTHQSYRKTRLEWGLMLLAVAGVVSCLFAGNQRLAMNGTIDWLCYPLLTILLVQLLDRNWHRSLLLAVILAGACAQSVECLDQYFVGFEDTWNHYESIKDDFWAQQGVDLSDPKVDLFENRIRAREATGFLPHSNIAGSYLVLCVMAAIGLIISSWKRKIEKSDDWWILALLVMFIVTSILIFAIVLTKSLGAWVSAGAGIFLWVILFKFRDWIAAHHIKSVVIGWLCFLFVILAVGGHGMYHDSLPGWSLTFRWQYWRNTADLVADYPLTGVGRENFGRHYLQYKAIDSPEEVSNPHNLFIQAASDWGIPGLIGLVMMMIGVSIVITRPLKEYPHENKNSRGPPSGLIWFGWLVGLVIVVTLIRLPLLGSDDPNFLYFRTIMTIVPWLAMMVCVLYLLREDADQSVANRRVLRIAMTIGIFTFLLHDMINFSAFVPATAILLFSMLALGIAQSTPCEEKTQRLSMWWRWCPVSLAAAITLCIIYVGVLPAGRAMQNLERARESAHSIAPGSLSQQMTTRYYDRASMVDPMDPTPLTEKAQWLMTYMDHPKYQSEAFDVADKALRGAISRDPYSLKLHRLRTIYFQKKSLITSIKEDYFAAIEAAKESLNLYPQDPLGLVVLADCFIAGGVTLNNHEWVQQATIQYQNALDLDDRRISWETLQRFSQKKVEYIQERLNEAKQFLQGSSR